MPEGDTLHRTADGLRPHLVGRVVSRARAGGPGALPRTDRLTGSTVTAVEALGKNLIIRFDNGLEIRTHLRMNGSWHRYRPGEPWRRPVARARLVLEVPGTVAVCFDAPVVELLETRAEGLHPALAGTRAGPPGGRLRNCRSGRGAAPAARPGPGRSPDRRGPPRPARPRRDRQRLQERGALSRAGRPVATGRRGRRRYARAARGRRSPAPRPERGSSPPTGTGDDRSGSGGRRPGPLGLRPGGSALPPVRDAHPASCAGRRAPAPDLLVPALPGPRSRLRPDVVERGRAPVQSGPMCEHYVARAAEPFRIDELWSFTERLERYGLAGFGWGAAWTGRRRVDRVVPRRPGLPRRPRARRGRRDRDHRPARPSPPPVPAVDPDSAGHPAVHRSGRPVRLLAQRGPARLPSLAGALPTGGSDPRPGRHRGGRPLARGRLGSRGARRPSPGHAPRRLRRRREHGRAEPPTGRPYHYAGNAENPVFTFRLGRIRLASTGIYSLDRSLFRFVAPGAQDRALVRMHSTVALPAS